MDHPAEELRVRDAGREDAAALCAIRYSRAMHTDPVDSAAGGAWRYVVAELGGEVVGFCCLLFAQPDGWQPVAPLPKIVDLCVREDRRSRGIGSRFMGELERLAREAGFGELWLSVDPEKNERALRFYRRLGYAPASEQWQWATWDFLDSAGVRHRGEGWDLTRRRAL